MSYADKDFDWPKGEVQRAASAPRRWGIALAIGICAVTIGIGQQGHATDSMPGPRISLQHVLMQLADQVRPATLGLTITDLQSGRTWRINASRPFPMMSVFKAPLGAAVLSKVDRGILFLGQRVIIKRQDLRTWGVSQITATFHGDQEAFTVRQLLEAAVSHSDNTAADVLLKLVGGPVVATAFLRSHGVRGMRVDRGERDIAQEFQEEGVAQGVGSEETPTQKDARLRRGYAAYLNDPRDRTTPDAAARFLEELWQGQLLSPTSTRLLLSLLYNQTVPSRLRAGVPANVRLADKCGTSYTVDGMTAAFNDIGILSWPDGHTVIVAAFLTASHAPRNRMNASFKDIAQAVITGLHP
ncbi:MAG: class A beta-lactamase [Steroidobacteraceae bacterium]